MSDHSYDPGLRGFGPREMVWAMVLLAYTVLFVYLLLSGRIRDLVHPRFVPFTIMGAIGLALLSGAQLASVARGRRQRSPRSVLALFLLPFVAVPLFVGSSSSTLAGDTNVTIASAFPSPTGASQSGPTAPIPATGPIVLDRENYYSVYTAIYGAPATYAGRRVTVTGFVYKSPITGPGRFLTARELMWCCAVDVATIGFLSDFGGRSVPAADTWVTVSGTLATTTMTMPDGPGPSTVPLLLVDTLRVMKSHDFTFVYPTF